MSTTIDSRVVEMRFDNQHFEKNVQTSLSTLDKLKQKLNLTGASKGLENINAAAKNNNMGVLGSAVQAVEHKFSALQVMGITALANITNSAVNAGKRMVKALTIDPVTSGWSEYELKMGSIQTIMASTGESLDTVNKYLNELNEYSDKTIYSFSDMTQNIGKFTNAGVKLEDAVMAIKGISNEAAISGANANEASRAMYNFAQALSAGHVKLIDWKSIENANMATVGFKEQLLESAVAAGTLTRAGDGLYKTLDGNVVGATKNFNETLQDEWMTTEVLVSTLKKYADETTDIGKKATQAATEVKTFSQMMDALKESAQSGWAQTWEIIFGDFNQGKTLWTNINNVIGGFIDKMNKARNTMLRSAFSSPWEKLTTKINEAGIETEDFKDKLLQTAKKHGSVTDKMLKDENAFDKALKEGVFTKEIVIETLKDYANTSKKSGESTEDMTEKLEKFQKVVNEVWRGDYKNGKERIDELTKAGYDYAEVQELVNKTVDGHKLKLEDLSDSQLKSVGYTDKQIAAIRKLAEEAEKSGTSLNELIEDISKPSGRTLFFDSFKNVFEEFVKLLDIVKEAWNEVFGDVDAGDMLYNVIEGIHEFTESLNISEDAAENFHSIVKGIFSLMDLSWSLASASFMGGLKIVNEILKLFGTDLLKVLGLVGDKISEFNEWVEDLAFFGSNTKWADFAQVFVAIYEGVSKCVKAFGGLKAVKGIISDVTAWFGKFAKVFSKGFDGFKIENVVKTIENFFTGIEKWIKGLDDSEMFNAGVDIVRGLAKGLASGAGMAIDAIINLGKSIIEWFKSLLGIHSPSTVFMGFGKWIIAGLVLGLSMGHTEVGKKIKELATELVNNGGEMIKGFIDAIQNGFDKSKDFLAPFAKKFVEIFGEIDFGSILASAIGLSMLSFFKTLSGGIDKVGDALGILAKPIEGIGKILGAVAEGISTLTIGFSKMQKAFTTNMNTKSIKNLAISIAILAGALVGIALMVNKYGTDELWNAVGILAALSGIMFVLAGATAIMSKASVNLSKTGLKFSGLNVGLIGLTATLLILAGTVKLLGGMDPDQLKQGFDGMAGLLLALVGVFIAYGTLAKFAEGADVGKLGRVLISFSISLLLLVGVVKLIAGLSEDEVSKGSRAILAFAGVVAAISLISRFAGTWIDSVGKTMIKLSFALLLMVGVAKLIAGMTWGDMGKAAVGILGLVGIIAILTAITMIPGKNVDHIGTTLLKISGALAVLAITARLVGDMEWSKMGKAAVGLMGLVGVVAMLVYITQLAGKDAPKIGLTLLALSVSIGILAAVAMVLGLVKLENLAKGITAVGMLGLIIAGIVKASKGASDIKGTMIGIAVAIGVMATSLALLSFIKWERLLSATAALAAVMLSFALITKNAQLLDKSAIAPLIIMGVIVGLLAFILHKIAELPVENALAASASLSILLLSLSKSISILNKSSALDPKLLVSVGVLTVVMGAIAGILYLIQGMPVSSTLANTVALSTLLLALSASMVILSTIKMVSPMAFAAVGVMTLVMGALAGILYLIQGLPVSSTLVNALALSTLLLALSAVTVILSNAGLAAPMALAGVGALAVIVAGVGALIIAIGALVDKFPRLEEFLNKGLPILEKIGYGLGSFFGNIVGGFMDGVTNGLPGMAADLSAFMINLQPFIAGAKTVDDAALTGITSLVKMIGLIAGASIMESIASFISGEASMETFATQIGAFGDAIVGFSNKVKGNIDEEAVMAAANAGKVLAEIQAITSASGLISWLTGRESLSDFGTQLVAFGDAIVAFSNKVKGNVDETAVTAAASAGQVMAELQSKVAPTGGVVQWFTGDKDMATFGAQLVAFGNAIVLFSNKVKGNVDEAAVTAAATAGTIMTEMQSKIVPAGGVIQWFTGDKDMATFGIQLVAFGNAIVAFSNKVKEGVDEAAVTAAATAGTIMTELQSKIIPTGGVVTWFTGKKDLATFGAQLAAFGAAMVTFSDTVSGNINEEAITAAANAGKVMVTLQKSIPEDKWLDGKVSLDEFGATISSFGGYIKTYSEKVAEIDTGAIDTSLKATKTIISITKSLGSVKPENIDNFKAKKLGGALKDYSDKVAEVDSGAVTTSISAIKKLKSLITSMAGMDASGVSTFKTAISSLAKTNLDGVVESFATSASKLSKVGSNLIDGIAKGMKSRQSALSTAANSIIVNMQKQITSKAPTFQKAGVDMISKFASGINSSKAKVASAIKSPIASGIASARSYYSGFYSAGSYLVSGFASGISANSYKAAAKAKAMANAAEKAAKQALDINSPSRVFAALGSGVVEGFVKGISDNEADAAYSSRNMAKTAINSFSDAISTVNDILNGDMDVQPTIRPVLDLSDVRSGAGAISGLLGNGVTMGALANVNAIGSMMNQNGRNNDVVSAINKLRKDLGNIGGTTNIVNGITYDDGSNVNNAVETLVRAAKIERRV